MAKSSKKKGVTKKTTTRKRGTTKIKYESTKEIKVDKVLVDNFVALQKVMVNLSSKFDNLSDQISKLLQLFEISAKSLARKSVNSTENLDAKKVMEKLDNLTAQAGLIGKGLALIHEVGTETRKPIIPLNLQNKPRIALQKSPSTIHQKQNMQPSILNQESVQKRAREITTEKPENKKIPGFNENAT